MLQNAYYAHTPPADDMNRWHTMQQHTDNVTALATAFADTFGAAEPARWAAMLHDIGKYSPEFQDYLKGCHAAAISGAVPPRPGSAEHKAAGAYFASNSALKFPMRDIVSMCVFGHHGGLVCATELPYRIKEIGAEQDLEAVVNTAKSEDGMLGDQPNPTVDAFDRIVSSGDNKNRDYEMLLRFVFSCLVDADSLDTEAHFSPDHRDLRRVPELAEVAVQWAAAVDAAVRDKQQSSPDTAVKRIREDVYRSCLAAALHEPGVFSLTVPTGGGKTLASLAFAVAHTIAHMQSANWRRSRIIYAIPYTSIIDQTAQVFRDILGESSVLEHHSSVHEPENAAGDAADESEKSREQRRRLASENWDHPLILTTTVQLFESLFSNRTSRCRKLHNIAGSVIILDEVQTLPPHLLTTIVDGLRLLVAQFNVTVVLCTATQPALVGDSPLLRGLPKSRQIVPGYEQHFRDLKRVHYSVRLEPISWEDLAFEMQEQDGSYLAVLNTKKDALALFDQVKDLPNYETYFLSTELCGAHRRDVISEVKAGLLAARERTENPVLLVSTQIIEAGVDVDFQYVYRAKGPLDRIVQAAGRCNREGYYRLEECGVVVFEPQNGGAPPGSYETAMGITWNMITEPERPFDFDSAAAITSYFGQFYQQLGKAGLDADSVQADRSMMHFPNVAKKVKLIEQGSIPTLVPYGEVNAFEDLVAEIRRRSALKLGMNRELFRRAQPYIVALNKQDPAVRTLTEVLVEDQLWIWHGVYDPKTGCAAKTIDLIA